MVACDSFQPGILLIRLQESFGTTTSPGVNPNLPFIYILLIDITIFEVNDVTSK